jgi:hypothetical protein
MLHTNACDIEEITHCCLDLMWNQVVLAVDWIGYTMIFPHRQDGSA